MKIEIEGVAFSVQDAFYARQKRMIGRIPVFIQKNSRGPVRVFINLKEETPFLELRFNDDGDFFYVKTSLKENLDEGRNIIELYEAGDFMKVNEVEIK